MARLAAAAGSFPAVAHLVAAQTVNETVLAAPAFLTDLARVLEFSADGQPSPSASTTTNDGAASSSSSSSSAATSSADKRRLDTAFAAAVGGGGGGGGGAVDGTGAGSGSGLGPGGEGNALSLGSRGDLQRIVLLTLNGLTRHAEVSEL